mmetsp:Transcript_15878/g.42730  ORF Transcript_15878/g.42730 Transcript_15878/m.42730 type:complete len:228 (-) Transcript_15878:1242-1925(-)
MYTFFRTLCALCEAAGCAACRLRPSGSGCPAASLSALPADLHLRHAQCRSYLGVLGLNAMSFRKCGDGLIVAFQSLEGETSAEVPLGKGRSQAHAHVRVCEGLLVATHLQKGGGAVSTQGRLLLHVHLHHTRRGRVPCAYVAAVCECDRLRVAHCSLVPFALSKGRVARSLLGGHSRAQLLGGLGRRVSLLRGAGRLGLRLGSEVREALLVLLGEQAGRTLASAFHG